MGFIHYQHTFVSIAEGAITFRQRFKATGAQLVPTFTTPLPITFPHRTVPETSPMPPSTLILRLLRPPLGSSTVSSTTTSGRFHVVIKLNVPSYVSCNVIATGESEVYASSINTESTGARGMVMLSGLREVVAETLNLPPTSERMG